MTKFHSNIYGWEYVWRDFADSKSGEIVSDQSKTNDPIISMHIPVEGTDTTISIAPYRLKGKSKEKGTSASIHFSPRANFIFAIRTEKGVDQVGKIMGLQDIQLGDQEFDEKYLVQGNDVGKVVRFFADTHLRDLLLEHKASELKLVQDAQYFPAEHRVPAGRHAVLLGHDTVLDRFEQLDAVFQILTAVVHRLGAIPAQHHEAEVDEVEIEPQRTSNKLHSPLLDNA